MVITRYRDGRIRAYPVRPGAFGRIEPGAVFRPLDGDEVVESAVGPDLERVVYTTLNRVVCLTRAGELVWASEFEPHSDVPHGHRPGCVLSPDGRTVWVYRPDAMAGHGSTDQWVLHDADSGRVVALRDLGTVGHGAGHHVHPVAGSVYLDIGEGQDGGVVVRGTAGSDGEPEFVTYPWLDRCLIDLAPDERQFMDHGQQDVAFHRHPGNGGCESEDEEEWFRHHLVDVGSGAVGAELAVDVANPYALRPLGDGSLLVDGPDGHPVRRSAGPRSGPRV
ncbi:hypothetical protein [Streptomyces sp. NPDC058157]|uniref:hypothetical protein n=1 Tax=Streptomyces sp. NPDC058157 TaxID=3346360 RepID=UPI0036E34401